MRFPEVANANPQAQSLDLFYGHAQVAAIMDGIDVAPVGGKDEIFSNVDFGTATEFKEAEPVRGMQVKTEHRKNRGPRLCNIL